MDELKTMEENDIKWTDGNNLEQLTRVHAVMRQPSDSHTQCWKAQGSSMWCGFCCKGNYSCNCGQRQNTQTSHAINIFTTCEICQRPLTRYHTTAFPYYTHYVFALEYQHSDCLETTCQLVSMCDSSNRGKEGCLRSEKRCHRQWAACSQTSCRDGTLGQVINVDIGKQRVDIISLTGALSERCATEEAWANLLSLAVGLAASSLSSKKRLVMVKVIWNTKEVCNRLWHLAKMSFKMLKFEELMTSPQKL